jgi:hypothetical protein
VVGLLLLAVQVDFANIDVVVAEEKAFRGLAAGDILGHAAAVVVVAAVAKEVCLVAAVVEAWEVHLHWPEHGTDFELETDVSWLWVPWLPRHASPLDASGGPDRYVAPNLVRTS